MLALPWCAAPRDLKAGDTVTIGRATDETTRPPTAHDVTYTLAEDAPAGTILGLGDDGRLYPLARYTEPPKRTRHARRP
jgi:hypothetical protein